MTVRHFGTQSFSMKTTIDLAGRVAIVTGGSRGYGRGISACLADAGATVYFTARTEESLASMRDRVPGRPFVADVTSPQDWDRLISTVERECGRLDILVNNAGAGIKVAPLVEQSDDDLARSLDVNLLGAMLGCRRAVRLMIAQRSGLIVNISSVCGRYAYPGWSAYSAAKAGLEQFGRCLYTEVRQHSVRVTTLTPSWGVTDFVAEANIAGHPAADPAVRAQCTRPEDLGDLVVHLAGLPPHLAIPEMMLIPLVQAIEPM